jgi:hypothetical protein
LFGEDHGGACSALAGGCVDRLIDLSDSPIEIGHHTRLHSEARLDVGTAAGDRQITVPDTSWRSDDRKLVFAERP